MKAALAVSLVIVVVAAGCGGDSDESTAGGAIAGGWVATGILSGDSITSPVPGSEIAAVFLEDGTLSGSAGCNGYNTTYTTDGSSITIGPVAATTRFCAEPEGVMDQETAYLAALGEATEYSVDGSTMELLDADGNQLVIFEGAAS